jgi:hypothetical protein
MSTVKLRALVSVVLALTVAAVLVVGTAGWDLVTFGTPTQMPRLAGDFSATSTGWVPVAFGKAQLSVQDSWWVLYNSPPCPTGSPPGEVFVAPPPGVFHCPAGTVPGPGTTVRFGPPTSPHSTVLGHPEVINGIFVYPYPTGPQRSYLVPSLGVEITVDGPLGQRVLHTLTWSPRSVVLAPGSSPAVPSSWRYVSFAGLRFSVPDRWPSHRLVDVHECGADGPTLNGNAVWLVTAARLVVCKQPGGPTVVESPGYGVQVDVDLDPHLMTGWAFSTHCRTLHGLTVCPATTPAYSILVLKVTVPGRSKPVYVSIGQRARGGIMRVVR